MRVRVISVVSVMLVSFGAGVVAQLPVTAVPVPPPQVVPILPIAPILDKLGPILNGGQIPATGQSRVIVRAVDSASVPLVTALIAQVGGAPGRLLSIIDAQ